MSLDASGREKIREHVRKMIRRCRDRQGKESGEPLVLLPTEGGSRGLTSSSPKRPQDPSRVESENRRS